MRTLPVTLAVLFYLAACAFAGDAAPGAKESPVKFVMHRVGSFRSEALGIADFNGDGKLDIVAGPNVYLAPDFKAVKIRTLKGSVDDKGKGYHHDFANAPLDVDGDGKVDVISVDWFSMSSTWFRNTLASPPADSEWPMALIEKNGNFECGDLVDLDGDGKALEFLPHVKQTVWYEIGTLPDGKRGLVKNVVSTKPLEFGGGVGDVNGDGRRDILRPNAWFEAPADIRKGEWKEHPWALGGKDGKMEHTAQLLVHDINKDGLNDVIASSAHRHGIFWYQQVREGDKVTWKQNTIDDTWSQAHSLTLADINSDGELDLVTGKRFMAHNGSDPDETGKLGVYWYELKRGATPEWTKHVVSYDEGVGSGLGIPVLDFDGDGDLDIVVTGKFGGPVWFENKLK